MQKCDFIKLIEWGMLFTFFSFQNNSPYCVSSFLDQVCFLTGSPPH